MTARVDDNLVLRRDPRPSSYLRARARCSSTMKKYPHSLRWKRNSTRRCKHLKLGINRPPEQESNVFNDGYEVYIQQ